MPAFPELPSQLRTFFPPIFWNWWQSFRSYLQAGFHSQEDLMVITPGKGVIVTSANGHRWQITVNNAGTIVVTDLGIPTP